MKINLNSTDINSIITYDLYLVKSKKFKFNLVVLSNIFRSINLYSSKKINNSLTLFSIGRYNRRDYDEILDYVSSNVINKKIINLNFCNDSFSFNLKNLFSSYKYVINSHSNLNFFKKIHLFSKLVFYLNIFSDLKKISPKCKKYCSFSSSHSIESVFTLYFNKINVETFNLQHGLFFMFKNYVSIDSINYQNFISKYQLCWGNYTKNEFNKYGYNNSRLIVAGYPRKYNRKKPPNFILKDNCLVFLARNDFNSSNIALIEILNKFSLKNKITFHLKLHPNLNFNFYQNYSSDFIKIINGNKKISEILRKKNDFGWAISVNSAAYYESYMYNLICLRFNDGSFEDSVSIDNDIFTDLQSFTNKINKIPFNNKKHYLDFLNKKYSILKMY